MDALPVGCCQILNDRNVILNWQRVYFSMDIMFCQFVELTSLRDNHPDPDIAFFDILYVPLWSRHHCLLSIWQPSLWLPASTMGLSGQLTIMCYKWISWKITIMLSRTSEITCMKYCNVAMRDTEQGNLDVVVESSSQLTLLSRT